MCGRSPCRPPTARSRSASRTADWRPRASIAGRWRREGVECHHIIDPAIGLPAATDLLRVTVMAAIGARGRNARDQPAARRRSRRGRREADAAGTPCRSRRPRRPHAAGRRSPVKDPTFWILARCERPARVRRADRLDAARPARQGAAVPLAVASDRHRSSPLRRADRTRRPGRPRRRARARRGDAHAGAGTGDTWALAVPARSWTSAGVIAGELMLLIIVSFPAAPLHRRQGMAPAALGDLRHVRARRDPRHRERHGHEPAMGDGVLRRHDRRGGAATAWRVLVPPPRRVPRRRARQAHPRKTLEGALP